MANEPTPQPPVVVVPSRWTFQDALTVVILPLAAALSVPILDAANDLAQADPVGINWTVWAAGLGVGVLTGTLRFVATWWSQWRRPA